MSTASRTVSEKYNSANADIILVSSEYVQSPSVRLGAIRIDVQDYSNHCFAV